MALFEYKETSARISTTLVNDRSSKAATVEDFNDSSVDTFQEGELAKCSPSVKIPKSTWSCTQRKSKKQKKKVETKSPEGNGEGSSTQGNVEIIGQEQIQCASLQGQEMTPPEIILKIDPDVFMTEDANSKRRKQKRQKEKEMEKIKRQQVAEPSILNGQNSEEFNKDVVSLWIDALTNVLPASKIELSSSALRLEDEGFKNCTDLRQIANHESPIIYCVEQRDDCYFEAQLSPLPSRHGSNEDFPTIINLFPAHGRRGASSAPPSLKTTSLTSSSDDSIDTSPWTPMSAGSFVTFNLYRDTSTLSLGEARPKSLTIPSRIEEEDHYDLDYLTKQKRLLWMEQYEKMQFTEDVNGTFNKSSKEDTNNVIGCDNEVSEETMMEDQITLDQKEDYCVQKESEDKTPQQVYIKEEAAFPTSGYQRHPHEIERVDPGKGSSTEGDDTTVHNYAFQDGQYYRGHEFHSIPMDFKDLDSVPGTIMPAGGEFKAMLEKQYEGGTHYVLIQEKYCEILGGGSNFRLGNNEGIQREIKYRSMKVEGLSRGLVLTTNDCEEMERQANLRKQAIEPSKLSLTLRKLKDRLAAKGMSPKSTTQNDDQEETSQKSANQKGKNTGGKSAKWTAMKRKTTGKGMVKPLKAS